MAFVASEKCPRGRCDSRWIETSWISAGRYSTWSVGLAGEAAIQQAWQFAEGVLERFAKSPRFRSPDKSLLDFGSSWGRISRCFLRDFNRENIIGLDVSEHYISICRDVFPGLSLRACNVFPPTRLPQQFNRLYSQLLCFSHLSEVACKAWALEFSELLKPGGLAAISTRSRKYFDMPKSFAVERRGERPMFSDYDPVAARYDNGEFIHSDTESRIPNRTHFAGHSFRDVHRTELWPLRFVDFYEDDAIAVMIFEKGTG